MIGQDFLFHTDIQLIQHHLLKRPFSPLSSSIFLKNQSVSRLLTLIQAFDQYHIVLNTFLIDPDYLVFKTTASFFTVASAVLCLYISI